MPDRTLLVLDEAYIDTAPDSTALQIDVNDPRVVRMRTFSKAYGMAGARVGYALGAPELIMAFNKVRNHFGMSRASQAGALAALEDQDYLAQVVAQIADSRDKIADLARAHSLTPIPSATNFVTIDCRRDATFAKAVLDNLVAQGVFVRMPFSEPQNRCIRISCGTDSDIAGLSACLPKALEAAAGG